MSLAADPRSISLAHRFYVRIYLALLLSLAVLALAIGVVWRVLGSPSPLTSAATTLARFAQNVIPPIDAPAVAQQAALERLSHGLSLEVTLYAPDRTRIAAVGNAPELDVAPSTSSAWRRHRREGIVAQLHIPDGRWLVARMPAERHYGGLGLFATLGLLAAAVGIAAYPVVRRLTRRLEHLHEGVESLGSGRLETRVVVRGNDEVSRLAVSFNRAAARIEELVTAQRTLLAYTSHELRTPLTRIRMAIELAGDGRLTSERKAALMRDIGELDHLIDEILLSSRLETLREIERSEHIDLLALAAEECARYDGVVLDGAPLEIAGNDRLLRKMLRNLLDNAIRYGAPPVAVTLTPQVDGVELRVADHGPGIPAHDRERVFEPFYRRPGTEAATGYGLGLTLVRQIARALGGDVRYEVQAGGQAAFVVTLRSA